MCTNSTQNMALLSPVLPQLWQAPLALVLIVIMYSCGSLQRSRSLLIDSVGVGYRYK